jgi:hypothetical protein
MRRSHSAASIPALFPNQTRKATGYREKKGIPCHKALPKALPPDPGSGVARRGAHDAGPSPKIRRTGLKCSAVIGETRRRERRGGLLKEEAGWKRKFRGHVDCDLTLMLELNKHWRAGLNGRAHTSDIRFCDGCKCGARLRAPLSACVSPYVSGQEKSHNLFRSQLLSFVCLEEKPCQGPSRSPPP